MDFVPKVVMSSCSSLSFRLITKRQDNRLKAVFCLDLCLKNFALKNYAICTHVDLMMDLKKKRPTMEFTVISLCFSQFFFIAKTIT